MSSKVASHAAAAGKTVKLSPSVYFLPGTPGKHTPSTPSQASDSASASSASTPSAPSTSSLGSLSDAGKDGSRRRDPGLILLGTWMGAAPKHIQKYTDAYRHLFPSSPILLLRSEPTDFMKPRAARENLRPAARILEAYAQNPFVPLPLPPAPSSGVSAELLEKTGLQADGSDKADANADGTMLVHVWSNGGSNALWSVRRQCAAFPHYRLIMDSCPGQFHYRATYTAFSLTIPYPWLRRLLAPLLHALCCWFWVRLRLPRLSRLIGGEGRGGPLRLSADSHNDPKLLGVDVGRTYIYSDEDALVPSADVEEHGKEAQQAGFKVRMEKFRGSQHVAHAKKDPERYWRLVRQTWGAGQGGEAAAAAAKPQVDADDEKRQLDDHYRNQAQSA